MSEIPSPKLKIMVASSVYPNRTEIGQICVVLMQYGYEVICSHIGTIRTHPGKSNLENCLCAVKDCDVFLGIIYPYYGSSGEAYERSIVHEEMLEAIRLGKPRWFLVHHDVVFAKKLLEQYRINKEGQRVDFKFEETDVLDDLRVIDMYEDAILTGVPVKDRKGNWCQEFFEFGQTLTYIETQFKNIDFVRVVCEEMRKQ